MNSVRSNKSLCKYFLARICPSLILSIKPVLECANTDVEIVAMLNIQSFVILILNLFFWFDGETLALEATVTAISISRSASAPSAVSQSQPAPGGIGAVVPPNLNGYKTFIAPPTNRAGLKIAIFDGKGAPMSGIKNVCDRVKGMPGWTITLIKPEEIAKGGLVGYDVVVFSGGSGGTQAKSLGRGGQRKGQKIRPRGRGIRGHLCGSIPCVLEFFLGTRNYECFNCV